VCPPSLRLVNSLCDSYRLASSLGMCPGEVYRTLIWIPDSVSASIFANRGTLLRSRASSERSSRRVSCPLHEPVCAVSFDIRLVDRDGVRDETSTEKNIQVGDQVAKFGSVYPLAMQTSDAFSRGRDRCEACSPSSRHLTMQTHETGASWNTFFDKVPAGSASGFHRWLQRMEHWCFKRNRSFEVRISVRVRYGFFFRRTGQGLTSHRFLFSMDLSARSGTSTSYRE